MSPVQTVTVYQPSGSDGRWLAMAMLWPSPGTFGDSADAAFEAACARLRRVGYDGVIVRRDHTR